MKKRWYDTTWVLTEWRPSGSESMLRRLLFLVRFRLFYFHFLYFWAFALHCNGVSGLLSRVWITAYGLRIYGIRRMNHGLRGHGYGQRIMGPRSFSSLPFTPFRHTMMVRYDDFERTSRFCFSGMRRDKTW